MSSRWIGLGLVGALVLVGGCSGDTKTKVTEPPVQPPKAASNLYAASTSTTRIVLRWRDNSDVETGFRIQRREGDTGEFLPVAPTDTVGANVTTYEDARVADGTSYTYRVVTYRLDIEAAPSNEVTVLATAKLPPNTPSDPYPPDVAATPGAANVDESVPLTLTWVGSDPAGEALTYDVLFGRTLGTIALKEANRTETNYLVTETLERNAHYFWRVIAHDRTGVSAPSPVWGFNTTVDRDTVEAGFFVMGDTLQFIGDVADSVTNPLWHPGNPIETRKFSIDRFLVTNQQFADFLNQALAAQPRQIWLHNNEVYDQTRENLWAVLSPLDTDSDISFSAADSAFVVSEGREGFPVVQVSWYGADAYARRSGRRLPAEAEWEKAARGTARDVLGFHDYGGRVDTVGLGTPYPWGRWTGSGDLNRGNYLNSGDPFENAGRVRTTPPGFFNGSVNLGYQTGSGASPCGAYDMSGNVWQWTADWYDVYHNPHQPPVIGNFRMIRGGSYDKPQGSAICWNRSYLRPEQCDRTVGFRTVGAAR
jgi:formylglycine-generating enzyme required for sulfatase activity